MMQTERNGFTTLEIVLIVIVLAALGFAGWTYYQSAQRAQRQASAPSQTQNGSSNQKESKSAQEDQETTFEFVTSNERDTKDFGVHPVNSNSTLQGVELRISNTSETAQTYFAQDFQMETTTGELIEVWDPGDTSIQFDRLELAGGGQKTVSLKFRTKQPPAKLHWSPDDYIKDRPAQKQETKKQVIELE